MVYITKTAEETFELGQRIGSHLVGGEVLTLHGDLGAGKTTLTQGIAKGLGIENQITSPTFIIQRTYELPENAQGIERFYHVDLYRLENADDEANELGITSEWGRKETVFAIEWPERLSALPDHIEIKLSVAKNGEHVIQLIGLDLPSIIDMN